MGKGAAEVGFLQGLLSGQAPGTMATAQTERSINKSHDSSRYGEHYDAHEGVVKSDGRVQVDKVHVPK